MSDLLELQRTITQILLTDLSRAGFALAGSGAIREHGLTTRPTEDVDLFTPVDDPQRFDAAVTQAIATLTGYGYQATEVRRSALFARIEVAVVDLRLEVDLGVDWRGEQPVALEVGPVLALKDAVANKIGPCSPGGRSATISTSTRYASPAPSTTKPCSSWPQVTTPASTADGSPTNSAAPTSSAHARSASTASMHPNWPTCDSDCPPGRATSPLLGDAPRCGLADAPVIWLRFSARAAQRSAASVQSFPVASRSRAAGLRWQRKGFEGGLGPAHDRQANRRVSCR